MLKHSLSDSSLETHVEGEMRLSIIQDDKQACITLYLEVSLKCRLDKRQKRPVETDKMFKQKFMFSFAQ